MLKTIAEILIAYTLWALTSMVVDSIDGKFKLTIGILTGTLSLMILSAIEKHV